MRLEKQAQDRRANRRHQRENETCPQSSLLRGEILDLTPIIPVRQR
jgi:hypothetical protein